MKKIVLILCGIITTAMAKSQIVTDNFQVGPYEVDYLGKGDVNYRLKKGTDLYDFYGLKKDTIINVSQMEPAPVKGTFQIDFSIGVPRFLADANTNVMSFGVNGAWKQNIARNLYFNGGLSLSLNFSDWGTMPQIGVPLSIELSNIDYNKASLYGSIGVVPTFYTNVKDDLDESKSGFFVAPQLEFGAYVPVKGHLVRIGGYVSYPEINCSGGEDLIKKRYGRLFIGANIGWVF